MKNKGHVIVVGAGLCGTLLAIRLAQRGYRVSLHEKRPDMRKEAISAGRSINLALSQRGLKALRMIGLEERILEECTPMYGRMIHSIEGDLRFSRYSGRDGEFINSVSRGGLNSLLLDAAETYDNLEVSFNSTCTSVFLKGARAVFRNEETGLSEEVHADVVFGTDGAGSAVRRSMMAQTTNLLFNYSQHFLRHGYKELSILPVGDGEFAIEKNALHIWPRGGFMLIALPNLDGSFTVTLFHPFEGRQGLNALNNKRKVLNFFEEHFSDVIPHMPGLLTDFFANPNGTLGTIKCYPWQAYGKTLLLGDAAHAIVPFYGQGMNASFEDVVVLDEVMDHYEGDWEKLFEVFQQKRAKDTNAIADLAIDNFYEMRDYVANPVFVRKRDLEMQLEEQFPDYFSKYSMVTFNEEMSYSEAMEKGRRQDELLLDLCRNNGEKELDLQMVLKQIKAL